MRMPRIRITGLGVAQVIFLLLLIAGLAGWIRHGGEVGVLPPLVLFVGVFGSIGCLIARNPDAKCIAGALIMACALLVLGGMFMLLGIILAVIQRINAFVNVGLGLVVLAMALLFLGTVRAKPSDKQART